MSYEKCFARIRNAAGRDVTDDEMAAIFTRIEKARRDIMAGRIKPEEITSGTGKVGKAFGEAMTPTIREVAEQAAKRMQAEAIQAKRVAAMQVLSMTNVAQRWRALVDAGLDPLESALYSIGRNFRKGNVESIEQRMSGVKGVLMMQLRNVWDALGAEWYGAFTKREDLLEFFKVLRGEENNASPVIKEAAKAWQETSAYARRWFNQLGGDIGELLDWTLPQHHAQALVARAGRDEWLATLPTADRIAAKLKGTAPPESLARNSWIDYVMPRLNRDKYVDDMGVRWDDATMREFLSYAWDNIASNGNMHKPIGKFQGEGKVTSRHSEKRQLHFKDSEALLEYWEKFAGASAFEVMARHIETMSRDIALAEKFGPNANQTYKMLRDLAMREVSLTDKANITQHEGRASRMDMLWDYAVGRVLPSANPTFSGIMDTIYALNVAGKLGGAALTSFYGDKVMFEMVSHLNNIPEFQRWRTEVSTLNPANAADRRALEQQGLMLDVFRSSLNRMYDNISDLSHWSSRLANGVMRITGMQLVNDARKQAFGLGIYSAIGNELVAGKNFDQLTDSDVRVLRSFGVTEADWRIWQKTALQEWNGVSNILFPEHVAKVSDEDARAVVADQIKAVEESVGGQIADLMKRNMDEDALFAKQMVNIREAEAKAAERLNRYMSSKDAKLRAAAEQAQESIELLKEKIGLNEVNASLNDWLLRQEVKSIGEPTDVRVTAGRAAENARLGEAVGNAKRRIIERQERIRRMEMRMDADVRAKYDELRGDVQKVIDAADEWFERSQIRVERRNQVVDRLLKDLETARAETVETAKRNAIVKLVGIANTESEFAIVTPGWIERSALFSHAQRGTVAGELTHAVMQFKTFPITMFKRIFDAVADGDTPLTKAGIGASILVGTLIAGAMLNQTRALLRGEDPREMWDLDDPKRMLQFWGSALVAGGGLGIYGDFLYGINQSRYGSGWMEALSGPTIQPIVELGLINPTTAIKKAMAGEETDFMAQQFKDLKGFIPGQNIWWLKPALDHMVFQQVLEQLSPGYMSRMRSQMQREYGATYWWNPGEMTPSRSPTMEGVIE